MESLPISISAAIVAFLVLCIVVRRTRASLGLPIAYLSLLLINHLPGAVAHNFGGTFDTYGTFSPYRYTSDGMYYTAIGSCCFVLGVWFAHPHRLRMPRYVPVSPKFPTFCLYGGWLMTFVLIPVGTAIPSVGAAIDKGGAIWMLGALIGLRRAVSMNDLKSVAIWIAATMVYPIYMLLAAGFLSYGVGAALIVVSALAIPARSIGRVWLAVAVTSIIGITVFTNYFVVRKEIRAIVWSDAGWKTRTTGVINSFSNFEPFVFSTERHIRSLDERLNQNVFVGMSASRIEMGFVDYKWGWSLLEAAMSLVPRAIWPDKPVYGGSPAIVREMTGLNLSVTTSWGVGNVMEFYINFGVIGLIVGFVALGYVLGRLDIKAAISLARGDYGRTIMVFLPAVALIQPLGSLVEMVSGFAAAVVGALVWKHLWLSYERGPSRSRAKSARPTGKTRPPRPTIPPGPTRITRTTETKGGGS